MQEFINYRKYRDLLRTNKINDLIKLYDESGIDYFIKGIKLTGCLVNLYDDQNRYYDTVKELDEKLSVVMNCADYKLWKKMLSEVKLFNMCYKDFYNMPTYRELKNIEDELEITSFLIILEKYLYFLVNQQRRNEAAISKLDIQFEVLFEDFKAESDIEKFQGAYDMVSMSAHEILAFLLFYKYNKKYSDTTQSTTKESLKQAFLHIQNINLKDIINNIEKGWRYGGRNIKKLSNMVVESHLSRNTICKDVFVSINRRELWKTTLMTDWAFYNKHNKKDIINDEQYTIDILREIFFNYDENFICYIGEYEIKLGDLIKGYGVFKKINNDFLETIQIISSNELDKVCMIISEKDLVETLLDNNISRDEAYKLISIYTFQKNTDLFDTPLIKVGERYIFIPDLVCEADIPQIILSRVNQFNFRGNLFEKEIIRIFTEANIDVNAFEYKDSTGTYQCDVLFVINDDLFICECKAWGIVKNINGFYDQLEKCYDAKAQLDRIANKYIDKIEKVKERFKRKKDFRYITKVVITANPLGVDNKIDETYFVDYSALVNFIHREKPKVKLRWNKGEYVYYFNGFHEYEGEITYNKFIKFLEQTAQIKATLLNTKIVERKLPLNFMTIQYYEYSKKMNEFNHDNPEKFLERVEQIYYPH